MGDDNEQKDNEATSYGVSRRTAWWGLFVFAAICTAAHFSALGEKKDAGGDVTRADKWSGTVMIITMAFSLIGCCVSHFWPDRFVDKWLGEGALSIIVLGLWAAGLAAIMNPDNGQAVNPDQGIRNANLYFFSWASLAAAVFIFGSFISIQAWFKRDDDASSPPNLMKWYMFVAASTVVMVSSIRLYTAASNKCNEGSDSDTCTRVKYALSLGAVALTFGLIEIVASNRGWMSLYPELGLTVTLFALYIAGIALITFGDGPATTAGNLYFSTWIGFVLMLFLTSKAWNAVLEKRKGTSSDEEQEAADEKAEAGEAEGDDKKVEDAPPEAPIDVTTGGEASA